MAGTGFSFSGTQSSSSSAATSPSLLFASTTAPSSSPFSFSFSNPASTSTGAPSSSPSLAFGGFGASTTSSSASPSPFGFATPNAMASSSSPSPFGASSSGSSFTSGIFGSAPSSTASPGIFGTASSAPTASSTGSPLFGAASFGSGSAISSSFGASTVFGSSASSSSSGSTNLFSPGSSGSLFGSTTSPFVSSTPPLASGFGATATASTSPFSSPFGPSSSAIGVSSSVSTANVPYVPSFGSSGSSGLGSVPSASAISFNSATSSVPSAPSFASPVSSAASSTATASGFSFPAATTASSGSAFSFPATSSASSASSTPSFSFALSSSSSAASSSSSFLASSASAFSFPKGTGISAATVVSASMAPSLSSSSTASSGFSFGTSGFQTSAATPAPKPSFGTTTSPLFSTVTTTTSASTPAATTAAAASTSGTGLALNIPAFSPAASSAATAASTSGSAASSSGFTGFGATTSSGTTTATTSSFSLSTKLLAAGSSTQAQSTAAAPLSGTLVSWAGKNSGFSTFCPRIVVGDEDEKVQGEGEQGREGVLEQPLVEMNCCETNHNEFSVVGQDQGGKSDFVKGEVACSNTIFFKELEAIPGVVPAETILPSTSKIESALVMGDNLDIQPAVVDLGKQQPSQDVAEGSEKMCENSSVVSEDHNNEFSSVGQHQGGKSDSVQDVGIVVQDCEPLALACCTNIHVEQFEAIPTVAPAETILLSNSSADSTSVIGDTPNIRPAMVDMGKQQLSKDVAGSREETSESSSVISEVVGDEVDLSNAMGQAFSVFSHCSGLTNLTISPSDAQMIIQSIVYKHGDITKGSVVKSLVVRSTLLQVVSEVVHHLCNHTMNSLGSDELQLMQSLVDDVAAVGFSVDWLQERLKKVSAASKYHECCVHLERLGEQINAAKKSLMEMELQQLVWKKEVDRLKVELEGIDFEGSNLGEGLI